MVVAVVVVLVVVGIRTAGGEQDCVYVSERERWEEKEKGNFFFLVS